MVSSLFSNHIWHQHISTCTSLLMINHLIWDDKVIFIYLFFFFGVKDDSMIAQEFQHISIILITESIVASRSLYLCWFHIQSILQIIIITIFNSPFLSICNFSSFSFVFKWNKIKFIHKMDTTRKKKFNRKYR